MAYGLDPRARPSRRWIVRANAHLWLALLLLLESRKPTANAAALRVVNGNSRISVATGSTIRSAYLRTSSRTGESSPSMTRERDATAG